MQPSDWILLLGVGLLLVPIPPFATIAGLVTMGLGGLVKLLGA